MLMGSLVITKYYTAAHFLHFLHCFFTHSSPDSRKQITFCLKAISLEQISKDKQNTSLFQG